MTKSYTDLSVITDYLDRFKYLQLHGKVGESTFGGNRYLNQKFYRTDNEWLSIRDYVITRDDGCDMGVPGYDIEGLIIVHHIIPINTYDVLHRTKKLLDPNNLICTSLNTHNAIHYGNESLLILPPIERTKNDTCPWRQMKVGD